MKSYKYHYDSGHGWVQVPRKELVELNILDKITGCSYQRGLQVFLEEDCDATTFVNAYLEKHGSVPVWIELNNGNRSPIRYYDNFRAEV